MMQNIILIAVILIILGAACLYIYREKKKGSACVGCPYAKECVSNKKSGSCNCGNKN